MSKTNDIYEWIELYLLGQLEGEELSKFEAKKIANSDFAEDIDMIELEMYEQDLLPPERKRQFEKRLQTDSSLSSKLDIHALTIEAIHYFDEHGCCKDRSILYPSPSPTDPTLIVVKNRVLGYIIATWIQWVCLFKRTFRKHHR